MPASFSPPTRKPRDRAEPPGLDEFALGASNVHVLDPPTHPAPPPPAPSPEGPPAAASPASDTLGPGMNVRFTHKQKRVLEALAAREERSQQVVLQRLIRPLFDDLARELGID